MKNMIFAEEQESYPIAILIKSSSFREDDLRKHYIRPLVARGLNAKDIVAFPLEYFGGTVKAGQAKEWLRQELYPELKDFGVKFLYIADAAYFRIMTKQTKAEIHLGYAFDVEGFRATLGINYGQLLHDENSAPKLVLSLDTLTQMVDETLKELGANIIKQATYVNSKAPLKEVSSVVGLLHEKPRLTCDIETNSLHFMKAGVVSIAFAWNQGEGVSLWIGNQREKLALLKKFFDSYKGRLIFHNGAYDVKVLIYELYMSSPTDVEGVLRGLKAIPYDDTKVIAYLALNSTSKPSYSLKALAHEFAGNYALDVQDVSRIPEEDLLRYNLVDCLSTWYVYDKYWIVVEKDGLVGLYEEYMLPVQGCLTQMELTGAPVDLEKVKTLTTLLDGEEERLKELLKGFPELEYARDIIVQKKVVKDNLKLKTKKREAAFYDGLEFNLNSGSHLQVLLYQVLKLPVLDYTEGGEAATGTGTLEKLLGHCEESYKPMLEALIDLSKIQKIRTSFIPHMLDADFTSEGSYLHGSYNLGGTLSGRLSSSNPNMQNLPSNSKWGKAIKECFISTDEWVMVGADFSALEERINTILTRDPQKEKVYLAGLDGHCIRAYAYFHDQMPDIDPNNVESINSIQTKYKSLRQKSKAPSFALQYQGTWKTLVDQGFSEEEAKAIEDRYHTLYKVSDEWMRQKVLQACRDGFVSLAFGLRLKTPLLKRSVIESRITTSQSQAESRTVGNAVGGQSYCMLTCRALVGVMERVWNSKYRLDVKPCMTIHDALYFLIRNDIELLAWFNQVLIEEMAWQELPEIKHPSIGLEAELEVYPDWAHPIRIPNGVSVKELEVIFESQE